MDKFIIPLLMVPPAEGASGAGSLISTLIPFALIIGIFYFLIIRPQNKKRKETEKMLAAIKKGDKVVTIGGLHGTVQSVRETTVLLKVDDNVKLEFLRSAVSSVTAPSKEKQIEEKDDESDSSDKSSGE